MSIKYDINIGFLIILFSYNTIIGQVQDQNQEQFIIDDDDSMEDSEFALYYVNKLINYYNETLQFEQNVKMLLHRTVDDEKVKIHLLTQNIITLTEKYNQLPELLMNPKKKEEVQKLYAEYLQMTNEIDEDVKQVLKFLDPEMQLNVHPIVEKAAAEFENLKETLKDLYELHMHDFINSAELLSERKLFPLLDDAKSTNEIDADFANMNQLQKLYTEWETLRLKEIDAMMDTEDTDDGMEQEVELTNEIEKLIEITIPNFMEENFGSLSSFVSKTINRVSSLKHTVDGIQIEPAISRLKGDMNKIIIGAKDAYEGLIQAKNGVKLLIEVVEGYSALPPRVEL